MRFLAAFGLLAMVAIHLPPLLGVLGVERLAMLYGLEVAGPDLQILMRHRAVLFGLLGGYQAFAVFKPAHRTTAYVAGLVSLAAFLALCATVGVTTPEMTRVLWIDRVVIVLAAIGFAAHLRDRAKYA